MRGKQPCRRLPDAVHGKRLGVPAPRGIHAGQALIPEVRWPGARTYIGLMNTGAARVLDVGEYRIRKSLAKIPGQEDNVGRGYLRGNHEIQVWDRYEEYEPGERVSVNGSILTVTEKATAGSRRKVTCSTCTFRQGRTGVSFVNSLKGRVNVRSSGIRVWTNGNMTLEAEEIAGNGQKITAEAGSYVWLGSGSSGVALNLHNR